jgi:hypothetical protein
MRWGWFGVLCPHLPAGSFLEARRLAGLCCAGGRVPGGCRSGGQFRLARATGRAGPHPALGHEHRGSAGRTQGVLHNEPFPETRFPKVPVPSDHSLRQVVQDQVSGGAKGTK